MTTAKLTRPQLDEIETQIKTQLRQLISVEDEKRSSELHHERTESEVEHSAMIAATPSNLAEQGLSRHHEMEIRGLEHALAKIAEGGFGDCEDCDAPIGYARLKAYPMALRCVPCQEKHEKHH